MTSQTQQVLGKAQRSAGRYGSPILSADIQFRTNTMTDKTGIRYADCDSDLKRRVGKVMGAVAERHIRLEDGYAFVALDGETPVGLIAVYRRQLPDPLSETDEGFINIIEVAESHRRRGIARRLIEMSVERSRKEGRHQLRAWSSGGSADDAIRMWKAFGFGLCPATVYPRGQEVHGYFVAYQL
jgi:ribosomal protein S18 acetylase RimI-like enzyme